MLQMVSKQIFSWLLIALFAAASLFTWNYTARFCKKQTGGFSILKIQSDLQEYDQWKTPIPSPRVSQEVSNILSQPFRYLESGGQCFAFVSEDGLYVLKLAKNRSYAFYKNLAALPLPPLLHKFFCEKRDRAVEKIDRDCRSYQIAYEEIPDLTALIYTHLSPLQGAKYPVTLIDKIGITHTLDLNKTTFLLQKKGEPIDLYLSKLESKGDISECRQALRSLLQTLHKCVCRGIIDEDPGIHRNFGFVGSDPFFIDVGRFSHTDIVPFPPFEGTINRFRFFLTNKHAPLLPLFEEELLRYIPKT